jgi:hypothetical protein
MKHSLSPDVELMRNGIGSLDGPGDDTQARLKQPRYSFKFPQRDDGSEITQNVEFADVTFHSLEGAHTERFRIHEYTKVFSHPGLYE